MRRFVALAVIACTVLLPGSFAYSALVFEAEIGDSTGGGLTMLGDVYSITGGGNDIWGQADGLYFVFDEFSSAEPLDITAQVGLSGFVGGSNGWRKAGVMLRNSLDAGSRNSITLIAVNDNNGINAQMRPSDNVASLGSNQGTGTRVNHDTPAFLRLEYLGDGVTFNNYYKSNVADPWTLLGTNVLDDPLSGAVFMGLAVTAHNVNQLTTVEFGNVQVIGTPLHTLTWDENHAELAWNSTHWDPGPATPGAFSRVQLAATNTDVVAVDAAGGEAFNLTVDGGGIGITDGTLAVTGAATFAPGTSLLIDGGQLTAGAGGSIASLQFTGTATLDVGQNTPVTLLSDGSVAGTLVKRGGGTVFLNNSSGTAISTVAGTAFRIEEGMLQTRGTSPLGQATQLDMAGGTFRLLDPVAEAGSFTPLIPPIAGWTFDADSGLIAQNVVTPGVNDGVLTNFTDDDSQWVAGKVGQALYFDGGSGAGNDDWVNAGLTPWDLGSTAYSVTMWARATDLVQSHLNESVFTSKPVSGAGGFQMDFTNANNGDYRWHSDVGDVTIGPVDTEWVHLAVTYDTFTGELTTYYNGQPANIGQIAAHNFTDYMIGRNRNGDRRFEGTLDEVFVYDYALAASDIAQMASVPPTDVSSLNVTVTGDSTLQLDTSGEPVFGALTLRDGILITTGRADAVTFASTVIHPDATQVGIGPDIPTDFGNPLDATGTALEVFSKGGSGRLTLGDPTSIVAFAPAGMTGVAIDAHGGELVMVGNDAWGGSNEILLSGGTMTIATSPGFQSPGGPGLVAEFYGSQIEPLHLWDDIGWTSPILAGADGTGFDPFVADTGGAALSINYPAGGTDEADGDIFGNLFGPAGSQYSDDFAVRFSGQILMEDAGDYNFSLLTNAGGAVWIDGQQVVTLPGSNIPDDPISSSGMFTVPVGSEGQWHDIVVGYYDLAGQAGIELTWDHGNQGDAIDPQYLRHDATPGAIAPVAMATHTVEVTADSTLRAVGLTAEFGPLTLTGGILTTSGAPDGMSFASTAVAGPAGVNPQTETDFGSITMMDGGVLTTMGRPMDLSVAGVAIDAGAQRVGFDPQVETDYGILGVNGAAVAIAKTGPSNWVLDTPLLDATSNAGSASIEVEQGTLTLAGANLLHGRPIKVLEGGTLLAQSQVAPLPGSTVELAGG
ncbi:MAG: hypothetical protein JRJ72_13030, partial [Deltaproteobacteria bacterium]|nr:hypothetical protein [Deltaproteobacteria bacterium]